MLVTILLVVALIALLGWFVPYNSPLGLILIALVVIAILYSNGVLK